MRIFFGTLSVAAGVLLFFLKVDLHVVARYSGVAIALLGLIITVRGVRAWSLDEASRFRIVLRIIEGLILTSVGAVVAIWASGSLPVFAWSIGIGLIVHGILHAVETLPESGARRVAGLLVSASLVIVGILTFTWPVLTVMLVKWAVVCWLIIYGARLLLPIGRTTSTRQRREAHERPWLSVVGGTLAVLVAVAFAVTSHLTLGGDSRPQPGTFYAPTADIPSDPGVLIRSEPLSEGIPDGAEAWKILYTTTQPDDSIAVSSGIVVAPASRDDSNLPFLSVAHGTTGVVPKCAPSLSQTPLADGAGTALVDMVTNQGWAAVISDYVGLGTPGPHPYLVGEVEARNVLDASRAAQQLSGLKLGSETVVWGHSQGGHGALWTGQVATKYAPEFDVLGVAAFAPASDLYGLANADKNDPGGKTVSAYIAASWDEYYPQLHLADELTPGSSAGVAAIKQRCFNDRDALAALIRGTQVPNQVFPDSALSGSLGEHLRHNSPTGPFDAPVLVAQGLSDPLVKPELQDDWVEKTCKKGIDIDYRLFKGRGHVELVAADSPLTSQIVEWTQDRLDGGAATPNCGHPSTY